MINKLNSQAAFKGRIFLNAKVKDDTTKKGETEVVELDTCFIRNIIQNEKAGYTIIKACYGKDSVVYDIPSKCHSTADVLAAYTAAKGDDNRVSVILQDKSIN